MLLFSLEHFPLCSFCIHKHAFQEGLTCSSAVAKQKGVSCLTSGADLSSYTLISLYLLSWFDLMCCLCPAMYSCFSLQGKGRCLLLCLCSTWHTGFPACNRTLNHYSGPRFSTELMGFQHSPRKIPHPIHRVAYDHLR